KGGNEAEPSADIAARAMQPLGRPLNHPLNQALALLGSELRRRNHLVGARTATQSSAWIVGRGSTLDASERTSQQIDPWRIGGSSLDQCAPSRGGLRAIAILLRRQPAEIARLHSARTH